MPSWRQRSLMETLLRQNSAPHLPQRMRRRQWIRKRRQTGRRPRRSPRQRTVRHRNSARRKMPSMRRWMSSAQRTLQQSRHRRPMPPRREMRRQRRRRRRQKKRLMGKGRPKPFLSKNLRRKRSQPPQRRTAQAIPPCPQSLQRRQMPRIRKLRKSMLLPLLMQQSARHTAKRRRSSPSR